MSSFGRVFKDSITIQIDPAIECRCQIGLIRGLNRNDRIGSRGRLKIEWIQDAVFVITPASRKEVISLSSNTLLSRDISVNTCSQKQRRLSLINGVSRSIVCGQCEIVFSPCRRRWIRRVAQVSSQ